MKESGLRWRGMRALAWMTCLLIGCSGGSRGGGSQNTDGGGDGGWDAGTDAGMDGGNGDGGLSDGGPGSLIYSESFAGTNGSDWPAPWYPIGNHVAFHDIQDNQGRFGSDGLGPYPLARMQLPNFQEQDIDVSWSVTFEDPTSEGSGVYVRQNGQYIGDGYALFLEGAFSPSTHLAFWTAVNGDENPFYA